MIEPLGDRLSGYFYFHGLRGALLVKVGREEDARAAFGRAIALAKLPGRSRAHPHALGSPDGRQCGGRWREIDFGSSFVGGPPGRSS